MRRTIRTAVGLLAAAIGIVVAVPGPASATGTASGIVTPPYVAMGDSYSSAAGVNPLVATATPTCSRSTLNYPHDIARTTKPSTFIDVTCSGARTSDYYTSQDTGVAPQLAAVTSRTRFISMTIGGNDEGVFSDSFFGCAEVSATS